jgi:hypothetical protein
MCSGGDSRTWGGPAGLGSHEVTKTLRLLLAAVGASLVGGCGGQHERLADGSWYGKVLRVNVAHRALTFTPACRASKSGGSFRATRRAPVTITVSPRADIAIYYRPNGDAAAGHSQSADLRGFAHVALRGHLPDFPPGWFIAVRDGAAVSIEEDSGIRATGGAEQRKYGCVWSRDTRRFVSG